MTIEESLQLSQSEFQEQIAHRAAELFTGQVSKLETDLATRRAIFAEYQAAEQAGIDQDQAALEVVREQVSQHIASAEQPQG